MVKLVPIKLEIYCFCVIKTLCKLPCIRCSSTLVILKPVCRWDFEMLTAITCSINVNWTQWKKDIFSLAKTNWFLKTKKRTAQLYSITIVSRYKAIYSSILIHVLHLLVPIKHLINELSLIKLVWIAISLLPYSKSGNGLELQKATSIYKY